MVSLARRLSSKPSHRIALVSVVAVAIAFAFIAGCGGDDNGSPGPSPGPTAHVNIVSGASTLGPLAYSPSPDTVAVGTTVTWHNNDSMSHTVTSDTPGQFDSGAISPGNTFSFKFSNAGSFPYHCSLAGHVMNGTIRVQ